MALALATAGAAQIDRYELGLRPRAFERQLADTQDPARQQLAFAELDGAVRAFFRFDLAGAARAIDAAHAVLGELQPTPQGSLACSLQLRLDRRLHDPRASLGFVLERAYAVGAPLPERLELAVRLDGDEHDRAVVHVTTLPAAGELELDGVAPGDRHVVWVLRCDGAELVRRTQGVALVADLATQLDELAAAPQAHAPGDAAATSLALERRTFLWLRELLMAMTMASREETVLPGARLLGDARAFAAALAAAEPWPPAAHAGEHWLRVPVGGSLVSLRLRVPPAAPDAPGTRLPLVVALHGAGGSENMFFDAYGDGAVVAAATRRGWFVVAPRLPLLGSLDVPGLVDALAARWPIDRDRVVLVGHSMGAAAATASAARQPQRFRAVAALGGGGSVPRRGTAGAPAFFVGTGERDFARAGALRLHRELVARGLPSTLREYAGVEHLAIVQQALPDVFRFFDATLAAR